MVRAPRSIGDYDAVFDPVRARRQTVSGKQLGDPVKAAAAMLRIVTAVERPPAHLLLGSDSLELVRGKFNAMQTELDQWEAVSRSTDNAVD